MIDSGLGFSLVPWRPEMERHLGREISGVRQAGGIAWSFGPKRGLRGAICGGQNSDFATHLEPGIVSGRHLRLEPVCSFEADR